VIDQPHLVIYSAATPDAFFSALSSQLISRGFLSRCLILDTPDRGAGQQATALAATPAAILTQARAWYEWQGDDDGNLAAEHPVACEVGLTPEAQAAIVACREACDARYHESTGSGKPIWSRCAAMAEQLALLYTCSAQAPPNLPEIGRAAAEWGVAVAEHLTVRLLWHVNRHVADGAFAQAQMAIMRLLEDNGGQETRRNIQRAMTHLRPREFGEVMQSLIEQERVEVVLIPGKRRSASGYRRLS